MTETRTTLDRPHRARLPGSVAPAAMPYFPVNLVVAGRRCLVVGGGRVAFRKTLSLLAARASVTVVAPEVVPGITALAEADQLRIEYRAYRSPEATGHQFVTSATGDPVIDSQVAADADAGGVWVNSADDPANCSALLPAIHRDGPVSVAVSTGGASPALASWLRDHIAAYLGEGIGEIASMLADARAEVRASGRSTESIDWRALLDGPFPDLVRAGDLTGAQRLLDQAIR